MVRYARRWKVSAQTVKSGELDDRFLVQWHHFRYIVLHRTLRSLYFSTVATTVAVGKCHAESSLLDLRIAEPFAVT